MSDDIKKVKEWNRLSKVVRRSRVIVMKGEGKKIEEIAQALGVNEKTVDRDLASVDVDSFRNELVRRQCVDIESVKKTEARLHWRSDLLEKLAPRRNAANVEVNVQNQSSVGSAAGVKELDEYNQLIAESVAAVAVKAGDISKDNSAEPLH